MGSRCGRVVLPRAPGPPVCSREPAACATFVRLDRLCFPLTLLLLFLFLEACPVRAFKALRSSHFGLAYCLEALVYGQVFNAFFTERRLPPGEFFFPIELMLLWSYFCYLFFFCPLLNFVISQR